MVAEPFRNWVLSGDFPAGRPHWEDAGAVFVDEIEPYENRKLWLLNGAHSLLAYAGQLRGHRGGSHSGNGLGARRGGAILPIAARYARCAVCGRRPDGRTRAHHR